MKWVLAPIVAILVVGVYMLAVAGTNREKGRQTAEPGRKTEVKMITEHRSGEWSPGLTDAEKKTLFMIAKDTLDWCVRGGTGDFSFDKYDITPTIRKDTATFVTLKENGMLRGCIGSLAPVEAMYLSVHNNAINAALRDFRFRPVQPSELDKLEVHISLLSPIAAIGSADDFKIGEHGIIIEKGMHRAVYLPEVAVEQKWTREETLASLCEKAGMNRDAWKQGAQFKVFSSVVLAEE